MRSICHSFAGNGGSEHKCQWLSEPAAPVILVVRVSFKIKTLPLIAVEFSAQNPMGSLLPRGVQAVQGLIATVEVDMAVRPAQACAFFSEIMQKHRWNFLTNEAYASGPMRGKAGSGTKNLRVFADGIHGNQAAKARTCDHGMFSVGKGAKLLVDEWFQLLYQKAQVGI